MRFQAGSSMFIICSTGRCGTQAVCDGLNRFSDHTVRHEPVPRLLREAYLKHHRQAHQTPELEARLEFFRSQAGKAYGESFRAPNLLPEIRAAVPEARFLVIIRNPLQYVQSAHSMQVFRKGGEWDDTRIIPLELGGGFERLPLAEKIAWHWVALNRYLLDFAESTGARVKLVLLGSLEKDLPEWAGFLGVRIKNPRGLESFLKQRPNSRPADGLPAGYDEARLAEICHTEWNRALSLANR